MQKIFPLLGVVIFVAVIGGGYFLYQNQQSQTPTSLDGEIISPLESPLMEETASDLPIIDGTDALLQGGSSHADPKGVFTVLYPNDYTIDFQGDGQYTRIYKRGEQQRPQSEMSDGVLVLFESLDLADQSLSMWIDEFIQTSTADGTSQVVAPKQSMTMNGYPGYTFTLRGLGESKYTILQKDVNSKFAVSIVTSVQDPQNLGYQNEVDAILSTVKVLK